MIRDVNPGSGSLYFTYPGYRGEKDIGSRIRIRKTPETYKIDVFLLFREKENVVSRDLSLRIITDPKMQRVQVH
jgi:hypothetical protein